MSGIIQLKMLLLLLFIIKGSVKADRQAMI